MDLQEIVEDSADAALLHETIGLAAERSMELEVGAKTGAGYGAKSAERSAPGERPPREGLADPGRERRGALWNLTADQMRP